ncbi:MAG: ribose-phosphate diphosphokinase [Bacilli bacterium]|nr:ribose-phosphate diphosphokinase [Bacilli bacterium]
MNDLKIIVMDGFKEVGDKIIKKIKQDTYIKHNAIRFSNGEGKANIEGKIRGEDVYVLCDIGNYGITYKMQGIDQRMSPDDHFQDMKRIIAAMSGQAGELTVVMPMLYESRQHRKKPKESLDAALALRELENLGVDRVITIDCHDPNVCNAVPTMQFENFYATNEILTEIIKNEDIDKDNLLVIAPDQGAMDRSKTFTDILEVDTGVFYKRRDTSKVVNGKNPIVEHIYMGPELQGKDIIVVDDMIASGGSVLDVGKMLKEKGANKVIIVATFGLFTEGVDKFTKAREAGLFDQIYTTNLTYIPKEYEKNDWLTIVDCSDKLAKIIETIHKHDSIKSLTNNKEKVVKLINEKTKSKVKEL